MGNTQVTKFHPVFVGASFQTPKTIKNVSGQIIYGTYSQDTLPGSSSNDFTISENGSETISNGAWLRTESEVDTEIQVTNATPKVAAEAEQQTANIAKESVTTEKVALEAVTGALVKPAVLGRRLVWASTGVLTAAKAEGTYFPLKTGAELVVGPTLVEYTASPDIFRFKKSQWEITGRTTKMVTTASVLVNAKAPGATFTAGVYQVEKSAGATGKNAITFKAVTPSSTTNPNVAPALETLTETESAQYASLNDGFYSLGMATTVAAIGAESQVLFQLGLYVVYT